MGRCARENVVEKTFVKLFQELGFLIRKVSWPGRRGAPDRLILHPLLRGKAVFVELKSVEGAASDRQLLEASELIEAGAIVLLMSGEGEVYHYHKQFQTMLGSLAKMGEDS